ncbi:MAG TPA: hypothetical protein DEP20_01865 [Fusobacteria bacterium]|nr:hypothetical protein [Fusobacteriota bacterium]|tara:strand:- start:4536 stop:4742 length:207 start_codon:yes stop_codon:yes gene_type:complete
MSKKQQKLNLDNVAGGTSSAGVDFLGGVTRMVKCPKGSLRSASGNCRREQRITTGKLKIPRPQIETIN